MIRSREVVAIGAVEDSGGLVPKNLADRSSYLPSIYPTHFKER